MGCFLACFGSSKDHARRKQRSKVQPHRIQRSSSYKPVHLAVSSVQGESQNPISSVLEVRDKPEEQLSFSTRKKVTFDSNVRTYEHVSTHESSSDILPETQEESVKKEKEKEKVNEKKEEVLEKLSLSKSSSEDSSITTSLGSYPPNHRYQNCRDSDDENDEPQFGDSDLDDEDEDEDDDEDEDFDGEIDYEDEIVESNRKTFVDEVNSPITVCDLPEREVKPIGFNRSVRDRSKYVHSVLNPVENLSQWKAVKGRGTQPVKVPQKENLTSDPEPRLSFSSEPSFKESSFSFKSKIDQAKKPKQEIAVDASLSNWLGSDETKHVNETSTFAVETATPERSISQGSNSFMSQEDRPILGALTVEELRQFSATSSPKKSPSRSPDEMPLIGTVGTYWNHTDPVKDTGSASSYKGIPNTTSKYREDKKVNWHSTPFETRLERALNTRGVADA
ncbi:protein JASON [Ziziphus jujuba]|uniref:Protein JASON n=1 Tax=Ziziphus jujuba TaxID=326968 RepID=A0A6P4AQJ6_ZIZJJ|nr:protein JASON [Ziziphus jujuba]